MCIEERLGQCRNVFDVAAVLYRECEDRRVTGDRRFHNLKRALRNTKGLKDKFEVRRRRIEDKVRPSFSQMKVQELRDGTGLVDPQEIVRHYREFASWLHECGYDVRIAAWAILSAIDACFAPEHARDLRVMYERRIVEPLNNNWADGLPRVFLKIPSPVPTGLTPRRQYEMSVAANLTFLAIIERMDPDLHQKLDGQLWSDLSEVPINVAVISPYTKADYFTIRSPSKELGLTGLFWVEAQEPPEHRAHVVELLHTADDAGATIAILPELASSVRLEDDVSKERFSNLRMIVLGSYHAGPETAEKVNRCSILGRGGEVIWEQCKREAYPIPLEVPDTSEILYPHRGEEEWIQTEHPQIMMLTPIGGIAVQICLDFLQDGMRELLCKLGCCWFFVPTLHGNLRGKFEQKLEECGDRSGAVCAIANNRCAFLWAGKRVKPKQLRRFYEPKPRNPRKLGEQIANCVWLLRLGEDR